MSLIRLFVVGLHGINRPRQQGNEAVEARAVTLTTLADGNGTLYWEVIFDG